MDQPTLGSYLRRGREEAGLTLESVAQQTKVPRRTLEALEGDRFADLPALVFVRGFVRAYCATVGTDPLPALEVLEERMAAAAAAAPVPSPADVSTTRARQPIYLSHARVDSHPGLRISHLVLVLLAVALFVAAYFIAGDGDSDRGRSAAAGGQAPVPLIERSVPSPRPALDDTRAAPEVR